MVSVEGVNTAPQNESKEYDHYCPLADMNNYGEKNCYLAGCLTRQKDKSQVDCYGGCRPKGEQKKIVDHKPVQEAENKTIARYREIMVDVDSGLPLRDISVKYRVAILTVRRAIRWAKGGVP